MKRYAIGLAGFGCLLAIHANASENANFECEAGASSVCHFGIVRQPGGMQSFAVQGHQRAAVSGIAPGVDWYMVSIDHPAPATLDACRHANFRCKVGIVHRGTNQ